ncbi:hypothetical protein TOPH_08260, partial [Tolypocladium ophioglossoides CBS 100239]
PALVAGSYCHTKGPCKSLTAFSAFQSLCRCTLPSCPAAAGSAESDTMRPLLVLAAVLATWPQASHSVCYFPDGSVAQQDSPCRDDTPQSTCCGQGYACLSNNICMATGKELQRSGASVYVRGSCTDKNWRSGSCPNFCADPEADNIQGGVGMAKCERDDKLFYCVDSRKANCDKMENILVFQVAPTALTTIGVAPASSSGQPKASSTPSKGPSSAANLTATATNGPSASASAPPEESSPAGAKTGVGVGVGVGVTALLAAGAAWFMLRRRRAARAAAAASSEGPPPTNPAFSKLPGNDTAVAEMGVAEMGVAEVEVGEMEAHALPEDEYKRRQTPRYELAGA